jgi:hypothetical protein
MDLSVSVCLPCAVRRACVCVCVCMCPRCCVCVLKAGDRVQLMIDAANRDERVFSEGLSPTELDLQRPLRQLRRSGHTHLHTHAHTHTRPSIAAAAAATLSLSKLSRSAKQATAPFASSSVHHWLRSGSSAAVVVESLLFCTLSFCKTTSPFPSCHLCSTGCGADPRLLWSSNLCFFALS